MGLRNTLRSLVPNGRNQNKNLDRHFFSQRQRKRAASLELNHVKTRAVAVVLSDRLDGLHRSRWRYKPLSTSPLTLAPVHEVRKSLGHPPVNRVADYIGVRLEQLNSQQSIVMRRLILWRNAQPLVSGGMPSHL